MLKKIFGNDLVAKRKTKVTLVLNKRAYVGIVVLMQKLHYDCIKNKYGNNSTTH